MSSLDITYKHNERNPIRDNARPIIITGEVVDIILNESHADWKSYKFPGIIKFRSKFNIGTDFKNITAIAKPYSSNNINYPIIGEMVSIILAAGVNVLQNNIVFTENSFYYLPPINIFGDTNINSIPDGFNLTGSKSNTTFSPKTVIRNVIYDGDIIQEGRFGNSIIYGSTVSNQSSNVYNEFGSNTDAKHGDPFIVIRNGHLSSSVQPKWSDSVDYYTTSQHVNIVSNNSFDSLIKKWSSISVGSDNTTPIIYHSEPIQSENSISYDPRADFTDPSVAITSDSTDTSGLHNIPLYNQGDIRWSKLKASSESYNLGQAGCALSSLAMVTSYLCNDPNINPASLFSIKQHVLVYWDDIIKYLNSTHTIQLSGIKFISNPRNMDVVDTYLLKNIPVLFESKNKSPLIAGSTYKNNILESTGFHQCPYVHGKQHWMVIVSKNPDNTYNLHDPNGGRLRKQHNSSDILNNIGRFGLLNIN